MTERSAYLSRMPVTDVCACGRRIIGGEAPCSVCRAFREPITADDVLDATDALASARRLRITRGPCGEYLIRCA